MKILAGLKKIFIPLGSPRRILILKETRQMFIVGIVVIGLGFSIAFPILIMDRMGIFGSDVSAKYEKNIAILHLDEQITVPYVNRIMGKLEELREKVKEGEFSHLIIVGASPGGSPQGSDELANYLLDYQEDVPVTFYIQDVCASGCYYIASAIQKIDKDPLSGILSNANAVVGSIGVVMPHLVYGPALERLGFQNEYIIEGDHKVPIDSWSLASEESKKYLKKNLLGPVYKTFQNFVQTHRKLSDKQMQELNGGRIFISTLVEGTLVDGISYYQKVREGIKAKVQKQFPGNEVGFVVLNTSAARPSFLQSLLNVENFTIKADISDLNNFKLQ